MSILSNFAPIEEISNRLSHGEYLLLDSRSASDHAACRIPSSISVPPPISISDYSRVPSLVWVGLYCVSDDQQHIFTVNNIRSGQKILIAVASSASLVEKSWAKRLYELFVGALTSGNDIVKIDEDAVRFLDLQELQTLSPVMFSPITEERLDRWYKPPTILIPDFLYLSSMSEAINHRICGPTGYLRPTHIINASNKEASNVFERLGDTKYYTISVNDSEESDLSKYFEDVFEFIEEARVQGTKCLIHCAMGISRAPTLAIYYIMRHLNKTLKESYEYVKARRPEAFPNRSFMLQLLRTERVIHPERVSSLKIEDVGKIGGLSSEYRSKTPTGAHVQGGGGGDMAMGPVGAMCDVTGKCFVS